MIHRSRTATLELPPRVRQVLTVSLDWAVVGTGMVLVCVGGIAALWAVFTGAVIAVFAVVAVLGGAVLLALGGVSLVADEGKALRGRVARIEARLWEGNVNEDD